MSWVKHRDKLHEAALSSVKSISKIKTIASKTGIPQRPPDQNLPTLTSATRSSNNLPSWKGDSDYHAVRYLFHNIKPDNERSVPSCVVSNDQDRYSVEISLS